MSGCAPSAGGLDQVQTSRSEMSELSRITTQAHNLSVAVFRFLHQNLLFHLSRKFYFKHP